MFSLTLKVLELATSVFDIEPNESLKLMVLKMLRISQIFAYFQDDDMVSELHNKFEENGVHWIDQFSSWLNMLPVSESYYYATSKKRRLAVFSEKISGDNIKIIKDCLGLIMFKVKNCSTPKELNETFLLMLKKSNSS
jgi:hypothetical protein